MLLHYSNVRKFSHLVYASKQVFTMLLSQPWSSSSGALTACLYMQHRCPVLWKFFKTPQCRSRKLSLTSLQGPLGLSTAADRRFVVKADRRSVV